MDGAKKRLMVIRAAESFIVLIIAGHGAGAAAADTAQWVQIDTKYSIIHYQTTRDLKTFNEHVEFGPELAWSLRRMVFGPQDDELIEIISQKVDAIYLRVQRILDMRKRMEKVNIKIYPDKTQLQANCADVYNKPCEFRAWFSLKTNTVHITAEDLNEGMLAHEIAHSIIDHFLLVAPPPATSEILARYVDGHLHDPLAVSSANTRMMVPAYDQH